MTHTVSLLCCLSGGQNYVLMLATTDSSTTLLPALLVDDSTLMFSRQYHDSAAAWLWAWLMQLVDSWSSSPPTQSAWLGYSALQLLSTNSARVCWAVTLVTQQGLLSLTPPPTARTPSTNSARVCWAAAPGSPSTNSARICWAAATLTQRTALSQNLSQYVHNRGTKYYGDLINCSW